MPACLPHQFLLEPGKQITYIDLWHHRRNSLPQLEHRGYWRNEHLQRKHRAHLPTRLRGVWSDGTHIDRQLINLTDTAPFGTKTFKLI